MPKFICEIETRERGRKRFRVIEVDEDGFGDLRISVGDLPTLVRCLGYIGLTLDDVQERVL